MKDVPVSSKTMSSIDLIILGLLLESPLNAYELAHLVENRQLNRLLKISKPAIYKNCKKLYKLKLINGEKVKEGEAPDKVIYTVNKAGKQYFYRLMEHFSSELKPFYLDFNNFLWNIEKLSKKDGLRLLENLELSITTLKDWIVQHEKKDLINASFSAKSVVKQYRMILVTMTKWIAETIRDFKALK